MKERTKLGLMVGATLVLGLGPYLHRNYLMPSKEEAILDQQARTVLLNKAGNPELDLNHCRLGINTTNGPYKISCYSENWASLTKNPDGRARILKQITITDTQTGTQLRHEGKDTKQYQKYFESLIRNAARTELAERDRQTELIHRVLGDLESRFDEINKAPNQNL